MRRFLLPFYLVLSGCVPSTPSDMPSRAQTAAVTGNLPAVKVFSAPRPTPSLRANSDIARDFLELSFNLESGRSLPTLTRFEGPIPKNAGDDDEPYLLVASGAESIATYI